MHLKRLTIENIRAIDNFSLEFAKGTEAGWHVILGSNGSGKSSVIKAFALMCMGEREAYAARQDYTKWIRRGTEVARINGSFEIDRDFDQVSGGGQPPKRPIQTRVEIELVDDIFDTTAELTFDGERHSRTIWGGGAGWFSASFGPFRRFTGGDRLYDRLFVSNRRLAPHLTALGEDVALTEVVSWLTNLHVRTLQQAKAGEEETAQVILDFLLDFVNQNEFLPHGALLSRVYNDQILVTDGNHNIIELELLSDGYRSALSLVFELIRQMFELYGVDAVLASRSEDGRSLNLPGVIAIDEIDAHLHPTWQERIGKWLTDAFPNLQFIVTTHSPIVCRSIGEADGSFRGSVWVLPTPGSGNEPRKILGDELNDLVFGDVLEAYGTHLFGSDMGRSSKSEQLFERLATLNSMKKRKNLTKEQEVERINLISLLI